jgi:tight adherence protein B
MTREFLAVLLIAQAVAWALWEWRRTTGERRLHRQVQVQLGLRDPDPVAGRPATAPLGADRSFWVALTSAVALALAGVVLIGPGGLLLGVVPVTVRVVRRRRAANARAQALATGLGPALQLVADNLRVGRDLVSALTEVAASSAEPVRSVFSSVVAESRLGVGVAEALARQADIENDRHLRVVASAVGLHAEHGGNLTEILTGVAETITEEDRLRRSIATLTADGRYSARILMALPVLVLAAFTLIDPDYPAPLLTEPGGRVLTGIAIVLAATGWAWLRSLSSPPVVA